MELISLTVSSGEVLLGAPEDVGIVIEGELSGDVEKLDGLGECASSILLVWEDDANGP